MTDIRDKVSTLLNHRIPPNGWRRVFEQLNKEGRLDPKAMMNIIIVLCEKLEELEAEMESKRDELP